MFNLAPAPSYPGYFARDDGEVIGSRGFPLKEIWKSNGHNERKSGPYFYFAPGRRWVLMADLFLDAMKAGWRR